MMSTDCSRSNGTFLEDEDRAGLHPQFFVVNDEAGETPADEAGDSASTTAKAASGRIQLRSEKIVLAAAVWNDLAGRADQNRQQHDPTADERRQRMWPLGLFDRLRGLRRGRSGIRAVLHGWLAHRPEAWIHQFGQAVPEPSRLVWRQAGDRRVGLRLAVLRETERPKARSSGPDPTSTSCIRPYGTATRLRTAAVSDVDHPRVRRNPRSASCARPRTSRRSRSPRRRARRDPPLSGENTDDDGRDAEEDGR